MKRSLLLLGGLTALLAASASAQRLSAAQQKGAPRVKAATQPARHYPMPPAPLVGGTDTCTTPDPITGTGVFAFDNTLATTGTEGQTEAACFLFGNTAVVQDVWFAWVAPTTGTAVIESCNLTGIDTKIVAYPGTTCPMAGSALACSDDDCGFTSFQSRIQFPVVSGSAYVIQIGLYPNGGATPGAGTFGVSVALPPANDDCLAAQSISGFGRFAFDNTLATAGTQGQAEVVCNFFGSTAIINDVWYTWASPITGNLAAVTEGLCGLDTKIAVYSGAGCPLPGSAIGCNDDGGVADLQSIAIFPATLGTTYTIQLGLFPFASAGGVGQFSIISTTPRAEDNCATPAPIAGQGNFAFDNVFSTAGTQGQTEALCNFGSVSIDSDSWYLWTPNASGTATFTTCSGTFLDTKIALYNGPACPAQGTALACNEDSCGPTQLQAEISAAVVCGQSYLIQIGSFPYGGQDGGLGDINITIAGSPCSTPSTPFCDGSLPGSCLACGNNGTAGRGCANSSFPGGTRLASSGIASIASDTLVLTTTDMPGPGLFFQSNGLGSINPFGDGMLCAAVGIVRMGVVFPVAGTASYPGGLTPNPIHIAGAPVNPGDLKHYQCWYRDAVVFCSSSTFNTSNGVSLTWAP